MLSGIGSTASVAAPTMTLGTGFAIVVVSTILFSLSGGGLGFALGRFAPSYYRTVYPTGRVDDPVQLGIGLGTTQGAIAGVIVGCVIVMAVAISSRRSGGKPAPVEM